MRADDHDTAGAGIATARRYVDRPAQIWQARLAVAHTLGRRHPCIDHVLQLTSEVATGVLRRTGSSPAEGAVALTIASTSTWARIEVSDDASGPCHRHVDVDAEDATAQRLALIDRLADRWGVQRDETGTAVWFELQATTG